MARFVLEIGTEELPSRFLLPEETALARLFGEALAEAGLAHGAIQVMATPRRLGMIVENISDYQPERDDVITGPPVKVAYDDGGKPTRALIGFAACNDITPEEVFRHSTPKGEYVACRKRAGGKKTLEVLSEICPTVLNALPFAKRMRWGENALAYARPVRWIMALLDDEVVPFQFGPIRSGRALWGHRVHGRGPFELANAAEYEELLATRAGVLANPEERRDAIVQKGNALAAGVKGDIIWSDGLLEEVAGLVEHPVPLLGEFDPAYLEIPKEVLLTSMESHQKSFGVRDKNGELLPYFLTILNLTPKDHALVKRGWERVLKARLEDARFFWRSDLNESFDAWLNKLDDVIFLGPLGSMGEKSGRLEQLCQWLANELEPADLTAQEAARAGKLAKADLVSAMVGEFDTLQGIMGGIYAAKAGEPPVVAQAIGEQYLPTGPDTPVPQTVGGAILSMADKADTLAGCFGLDMIPSGAADPNGLRRCALGIIRILLHYNWHIDPADIFHTARKIYGEKKWKLSEAEAHAKLMEFFKVRLRNYFLTQGYDTVLVDAVLGTDSTNPADAKARLDAMVAFSQKPAFVQAAQLMKRIDNIVRKSATDVDGSWNAALLREEAEKELGLVIGSLTPGLDDALRRRNYSQILSALEQLAGPVDKFFDGVLVMCDDAELRENRLKMLKHLARPFTRVARFSLLQV